MNTISKQQIYISIYVLLYLFVNIYLLNYILSDLIMKNNLTHSDYRTSDKYQIQITHSLTNPNCKDIKKEISALLSPILREQVINGVKN